MGAYLVLGKAWNIVLQELVWRLGPPGQELIWYLWLLGPVCHCGGLRTWVVRSMPGDWVSGGWCGTVLSLVLGSMMKSSIDLAPFTHWKSVTFCAVLPGLEGGVTGNVKLFTTIFSASFLISVLHPTCNH